MQIVFCLLVNTCATIYIYIYLWVKKSYKSSVISTIAEHIVQNVAAYG